MPEILVVLKFHFYVKAKTQSFQEWCGNLTFPAKKWAFGDIENDVPKFDQNEPNFLRPQYLEDRVQTMGVLS